MLQLPQPVNPKGTHLAVGVQGRPHAWLQQPQCKGLQYIQMVRHLVTQWRCAVDDVLENSQSVVSAGLLGEEKWGGVCLAQSFLPYR